MAVRAILEKTEIEKDEVGKMIEEKLCNNVIDGYFLFGKDLICLPKNYQLQEYDVENLEIRDDDVILSGFPKSGTTWTQEMVWLLKNNLDYDKAKRLLVDRFPKLDCPGLGNPMFYKDSTLSGHNGYLNNYPSPRFIKTHLPYSLIPRQIRNGSKAPKIIYVMRNPKDVFISYFHVAPIVLGWHISKEDFAKVFLSDKVMFGPYWKNVLGYWKMKHLPNLLILRYEDMVKDIKSVIQKTCVFLERETLTSEQLEKLCAHLNISSMKTNKAVNYEHLLKDRKQYSSNVDGVFMREGKVGGYKTEMTPELIAKFDDWIKKHIANTDFNENYSYYGKI